VALLGETSVSREVPEFQGFADIVEFLASQRRRIEWDIIAHVYIRLGGAE
jgi:hypothetical protein